MSMPFSQPATALLPVCESALHSGRRRSQAGSRFLHTQILAHAPVGVAVAPHLLHACGPRP
eukprot:672906-Pleurochrysis_carterae.AAC.1